MDEENAEVVYQDLDTDGQFTTGLVNIRKDLNAKKLVSEFKKRRSAPALLDIANEVMELDEDTGLIIADEDFGQGRLMALTPGQIARCLDLVPTYPFKAEQLNGATHTSMLTWTFMFNYPRLAVIRVGLSFTC